MFPFIYAIRLSSDGYEHPHIKIVIKKPLRILGEGLSEKKAFYVQ